MARQARLGLIAASAWAVFLGSAGLASAQSGEKLSGTVKIDGSSTVAPIMKVASELFTDINAKVKVPVGVSGTGGGFKKFLEEKPELRTDISNASRPISAEEISHAAQLGVQYIELPIAYDGLSVVIHPSNTFAANLTIEELKKIWEPGSKVNNWKDVRAGFPDLPLKLYGAGTDSGTFDYFTEAVVGKSKASRSDYNASEDDNVLVQGVSGDKGALGYFGYSYYEQNKSKLKAVSISRGSGKAIAPGLESVRTGAYPLSRPLFIYVNKQSAQRPEVAAFVNFILAEPRKIVEHKMVNYIGLDDEIYAVARTRFKSQTVGTAYAGKEHTAGLSEIYGGKKD